MNESKPGPVPLEVIFRAGSFANSEEGGKLRPILHTTVVLVCGGR